MHTSTCTSNNTSACEQPAIGNPAYPHLQTKSTALLVIMTLGDFENASHGHHADNLNIWKDSPLIAQLIPGKRSKLCNVHSLSMSDVHMISGEISKNPDNEHSDISPKAMHLAITMQMDVCIRRGT